MCYAVPSQAALSKKLHRGELSKREVLVICVLLNIALKDKEIN